MQLVRLVQFTRYRIIFEINDCPSGCFLQELMGQRNGILLYAGAATFLFLLVPPVTAGITFIAANGAVAAMDRLAGDDNGDNDD